MSGTQEKQKSESAQNVRARTGTRKKLTQKRLKEILHYDPETGVFTWLVDRGNNAVKGLTAGYLDQRGYIYIGISGKLYRAHRLAWLYMEGFFPRNIGIDHEDQIKHHNWWSNLRLASQQCNMRNCGNPKNNTSCVKGVCWDKWSQKWRARVRVLGKQIYLGLYKSFDNAVCARLAGEQCLNWEGCDSNSPAYKYVQNMLKEIK